MRILSDQQSLQQIDSAQLYEAWIANGRHVLAHQYGMRWMRSAGRDYLLRLSDAKGNGRSLGVRSPETERIFAEFQEGKARADGRSKQLRERMAQQARMNKALRLGRAPSIVGRILRSIDLVARGEFRVIGTHALFAYEAMAGVHLVSDLLASGDVDLLADGRKKVSILADRLAPDGLIGVLRKADKTFDRLEPGSYRAVNADGFMVDFLIPPRDLRRADSVTAGAGDLVAIEVPGLQWLLNAQKVRVVSVAADGLPFAMDVPDPRIFCLHKAWLSGLSDRDPVKKGRDLSQARVLSGLIQTMLPQYPFDEDYLAGVPQPLKIEAQARDLFSAPAPEDMRGTIDFLPM